MTKELFVSSTPHETKVGLVEDDQLAEIYLERENEYTLAGSIYKGRVTRVLPGMQSAFVDIGLERDAFLYVSDFMELSEHDDDVDEVIPAPPPVQELGSAPAEMPAAAEAFAAEEVHQPPRPPQAAPAAFNHDIEGQSRDRGGWRGRRRRRGRHGESRDLPDSRYARPTAESSAASRTPDHTPPPGYQPMILPGESISKYQRFAQTKPAPARERPSEGTESLPAPVASAFPEDEPFFAKAKTEPLHEQHGDLLPEQHEEGLNEHNEALASGWEAPEPLEHERAEYLDKHAELGRGQLMDTVSYREEDHPTSGGPIEKADEDTAKAATVPETSEIAKTTSAGMLEEEEIDEEEADLASYVEELEEDAAFEEMEEETRAAEDYHEPVAQEIAAAGVQAEKITPELNHGEAIEAPSAEVEEGDEVEEEEAELDEAQAEAEALVRGEAGDRGEVRAEVRAPAGTAGYVQRAQRPGFDRRRGRRGGRRFRTGRRESQPLPQISDLLKEGQEILVQIAKEPIGKKGARITSHIALPGRFLVYMPTVNHTGVSRKISSDEERMRLKRLVMSERDNGHGGFIVRTAAQGASEEELRADIRFLKNLWSEIKNRAEDSKPPALIYHDLNVVERVLRDQVTSDFSAIWVDSEQEYERILRFANRFQPALVRRVKLYTKETPLFEQFNLSEEISKALKSKVWLKSGGYIVINQTEALVAIDVNTGKYVGKTARLEDTIVKTNVDAIKEIVRQVRLRDLGGIIVIDFIDMDERRNRQRVMQALEEALRSDRAPSKVLQFNDFGLVAITRKRVKQSLERTIGAPCPYCTGTGFVKSVATVCDEIYVEMRKLAKHLEHSDVMLRVNPEVAKVLKSNNGRLLNEMEELTKRSIIVKSDPALHQEQFDIN